MPDKELIKQEIERRIENLKFSIENNAFTKELKLYLEGTITTLNSLLQFIDSLPEEHNEDLEEEIENYIKDSLAIKFPTTDKEQIKADIRYIAHHFAEWQKKKDQETIELAEDHAMLAGMNKMKEEMMENAVETTIVNDWQYGKDPDHAIIPAIHQRIEGFNVDDKVKIIIIKEEE